MEVRSFKLDEFTVAYAECAIWASNDWGNQDASGNPAPLDDHYGIHDFSDNALTRICEDCAKFQSANWDDISHEPAKAGHDFWLTRNGHGTGFWDYPELWGEATDSLTKASKAFGGCEIYVSDAGELEF